MVGYESGLSNLKTLRIHSSHLVDRTSESGVVLAHLRRSIAAIGLQQCGFKGLKNAELLDELAEKTYFFLLSLCRQIKTVCTIAGRRDANFMDLMNTLYFFDEGLYKSVLSLGTVTPQISRSLQASYLLEDSNSDQLRAYTAFRLNKYAEFDLPSSRISPLEDDLARGEPAAPLVMLPKTIEIDASYLEQALKTNVQVSKLQERMLRPGAFSTPFPSLVYEKWVAHPSVFTRISPNQTSMLSSRVFRSKRNASGEGVGATNPATITMIPLNPTLHPVCGDSDLSIGLITKPTRFAREQLALTDRPDLMKNPPADSLKPVRTSTLVPAHLAPWYPILPSVVVPREVDRSTLSAANTQAVDEDSVEDYKNPHEANKKRMALQLELCNIQPEHPPILLSEIGRPREDK